MNQLASCHPDHLPVLYTLALWDMPLATNRLFDFLQSTQKINDTGIAFSNPTSYTLNKVKEALKQLTATHLIEQVAGIGAVVSNELKFALLLQLQQSGTLTLWIHDIQQFLIGQREYASWSMPSAKFCQREVIFAALSQNPAKFFQWRGQFLSFPNRFDDLPAAQFFSSPTGIDLFSTINSDLQVILLGDLLNSANIMLENCTAAYNYALDRALHGGNTADSMIDSIFTTNLVGKKSGGVNVFAQEPLLIEALRIQALLRGEPRELLQQIGINATAADSPTPWMP